MAPGREFLLGIDIGGTKTQIALGRADGELLREAHLEAWTSGDFERDLETIAACAHRLLDEAGAVLARSIGSTDLEEINVEATGTVVIRVIGYRGAQGTYALDVR